MPPTLIPAIPRPRYSPQDIEQLRSKAARLQEAFDHFDDCLLVAFKPENVHKVEIEVSPQFSSLIKNILVGYLELGWEVSLISKKDTDPRATGKVSYLRFILPEKK